MEIDSASIRKFVESEPASVRDPAVIPRVRELQVEPYPVEREWEYGAPGERFVCWTVLEHRPSNTGIAYCSRGFGPENPWGLVFLSGPHMSIGMDAAWYPQLEIAVKESKAWDDDPVDAQS